MNPEKFNEAKWLKNRTPEIIRENMAYRERHPEFKRLDFTSPIYFRILNDRQAVHWAIIVKEESFSVYFIDIMGQAFDKLEFKSYKKAKRQLLKNKFLCTSNVKCPYMPIQPVFVDLRYGKKSAPYSKGNLWSRRDSHNIENTNKIVKKDTQIKEVEKKESIIISIIKALFILIVFWLIFIVFWLNLSI